MQPLDHNSWILGRALSSLHLDMTDHYSPHVEPEHLWNINSNYRKSNLKSLYCKNIMLEDRVVISFQIDFILKKCYILLIYTLANHIYNLTRPLRHETVKIKRHFKYFVCLLFFFPCKAISGPSFTTHTNSAVHLCYPIPQVPHLGLLLNGSTQY